MRFPDEIFDMIARFERSGYEAYVVGGSLRDRLLGRDAFDVDMTTSALPEETIALFGDMRVIPTGIKHGTVTVIAPSGAPIEITTFRTDGSYSDSRHPDEVTFTRSLPDDLSRRDFTVNAMAYSLKSGVVDLFGGKNDLENKLIRCVGVPEKRFSEDALRILRAFRFSAQLGFAIEDETYAAAIKIGERISALARERVSAELVKLLSAPLVGDVLAAMKPILPFVLPEAELDEKRFYLCDTLKADPVARLALLCYGGDADGVARSLRFSTADKQRLKRLSTPRDLPRREAEARRMLAELTNVEDCVLCTEIFGLVSSEETDDVKNMISSVAAESPCLAISDLAVGGEDLLAVGVQKGRQMGEMLGMLLDAVIEDPTLNERAILLDIVKRTM